MDEETLRELAVDRDFWEHQFLVAWIRLYAAIMAGEREIE